MNRICCPIKGYLASPHYGFWTGFSTLPFPTLWTMLLKLMSQLLNTSTRRVVLIMAGIAIAATAANAQTAAPAAGPDPMEIPIPEIKTDLGKMPGVNELPVRAELPDPMVMNDGAKVTTPKQWKKRREEIKRALEYLRHR